MALPRITVGCSPLRRLANDRRSALAGLARALNETEVAGTVTNVAFLGALARHAGFAAGEVDTGLIARDLAALIETPAPGTKDWAVAALAGLGLTENATGDDPWAALGGFRLWGAAHRHGPA